MESQRAVQLVERKLPFYKPSESLVKLVELADNPPLQLPILI